MDDNTYKNYLLDLTVLLLEMANSTKKDFVIKPAMSSRNFNGLSISKNLDKWTVGLLD